MELQPRKTLFFQAENFVNVKEVHFDQTKKSIGRKVPQCQKQRMSSQEQKIINMVTLRTRKRVSVAENFKQNPS